MQTFKFVSDAALISEIKTLAREERRITHEVLLRIHEVETRKLHLELGFSSLVEWLVKEIGYSESAAYRRMQAARLLKSVPEAGEKLKAGEVTLTALAKIQSVVKKEEKRTQTKVESSVKAELIQQVEAKSMRDAEKLLFEAFPESAIHSQESLRTTGANEARLSVALSYEQTEDLKRVKELLSHVNPEMTWAEVIAALATEFLKRKDPLRKEAITLRQAQKGKHGRDSTQTQARRQTLIESVLARQTSCATAAVTAIDEYNGSIPSGDFAQQTVAVNSPRQPIPVHLKRYILQRDQGRCQQPGHASNPICGSRFQIEIDHIIPVALGGTNAVENLRCLCRKHNQLRAERQFGTDHIKKRNLI